MRHLFHSGVFVEGWAVYTEWMMCEQGFRDGDPLLKLITLKWYLRDVTNALLDQAVHVDGISRYDAMEMLVNSVAAGPVWQGWAATKKIALQTEAARNAVEISRAMNCLSRAFGQQYAVSLLCDAEKKLAAKRRSHR